MPGSPNLAERIGTALAGVGVTHPTAAIPSSPTPAEPSPPSAQPVPAGSAPSATAAAAGPRQTPGPLLSDAKTWVLALNGGLLTSYVAWLIVRAPDQTRATLIGDLAWVYFMAGLAGMAWWTSLAPGLPRRSLIGWRWLSMGALSFSLGNVVWAYYELVRGIETPFPSWADLGYLGFYPLVLVGIGFLLRPMKGRTERTLFWLDLGIVSSGAGTLIWYFLLWPIAHGSYEGPLALVLSEAYPLGATVLLVGAAALLLRPWDNRSAAPIRWLVAGLLAYFVADIHYSFATAAGTYASGGITDAVYHLSAFLLMVAAFLESRGHTLASPEKGGYERFEGILAILPYLSVGAVYGLLLPVVFGWFSPGNRWPGTEGVTGLVVAATIIATLVMIRQTVAAREIARLQAEQAAQESEARFASLARHSSDLIGLLGPDLRIRFASPAVEPILGLKPEDLASRSLQGLIHPDDWPATADFLARVIDEGSIGARAEWRIRRADGDWRDMETLATNLIGDPTVGGVVLNSRDITERKQLEREMDEARQAAEAANAAKSAFLALMSHEIRTPLNAVLGLAQILERGPLAPDQRDMVERIRVAGGSLLAIVNDILDLSKIEAGQVRVGSETFELEPMLARLDSMMGQAAREKGLRLHLSAPTDPLGALLGDRQRLEQVLVNLLGNAIKFTERGQVDLLIEAAEMEPERVRLRFAVTDTGIGIAPETLPRLFTPFTQADAGISRRFGGTGLGLAICKRLVELMGGEIAATSEVGQGSTFRFELTVPRAPAGASRRPAATVTETLPPADRGRRLAGARILAVDDSSLNRDLVERALALEGATATLAADGEQAVELLRAQPDAFDAVLMDIRMPGMDGLTATRLIRGELGLASLPVVALTAGVLPEERAAAIGAGVDEVLAKPLDIDRMTALLGRWILPRAAASEPEAPAATPPAPGALPEIPGIDRSRVAEVLTRDRPLFLRLLARLAEDFADAPAGIRSALAAGDREGAARRLHTLRGDSANLGATELAASARVLEEAVARGAPRSELEDGLDLLARRLSAILDASAPWRGAPEARETLPDAAAPPSAPPDPARLEALREALRGNSTRATRLFEALEPSLHAALGDDAARALGLAVRALRFADALAILDTQGQSPRQGQGASSPTP